MLIFETPTTPFSASTSASVLKVCNSVFRAVDEVANTTPYTRCVVHLRKTMTLTVIDILDKVDFAEIILLQLCLLREPLLIEVDPVTARWLRPGLFEQCRRKDLCQHSGSSEKFSAYQHWC